LKGDNFKLAGSTPGPYKDFLAINEEMGWLIKPPGLSEEKLWLVKPPGLLPTKGRTGCQKGSEEEKALCAPRGDRDSLITQRGLRTYWNPGKPRRRRVVVLV